MGKAATGQPQLQLVRYELPYHGFPGEKARPEARHLQDCPARTLGVFSLLKV
jgi:hypothetical protein